MFAVERIANIYTQVLSVWVVSRPCLHGFWRDSHMVRTHVFDIFLFRRSRELLFNRPPVWKRWASELPFVTGFRISNILRLWFPYGDGARLGGDCVDSSFDDDFCTCSSTQRTKMGDHNFGSRRPRHSSCLSFCLEHESSSIYISHFHHIYTPASHTQHSKSTSRYLRSTGITLVCN